MPSEKLLARIAEIADKADRAYLDGRVVFAARTRLLWGEDVDSNLALLIEAIEREGWRMEHMAIDRSRSGGPGEAKFSAGYHGGTKPGQRRRAD